TSAYQRRARLPGFRKGKAPAALVKKQFADDIRQQALEELIRESWKAALAQEALKPVADPHVHNLKWDAAAGGPVTFEFHVEVKPELTLERIGKFHLKRTVPKVTEEQVLAQLTALREQKAPWVPVVGEKPALKDLVQGTIATREGDEVKDPKPFNIVLGEGGAIPEVEERLMSMLPGETLDATVRFPPDFPEERWAEFAQELRRVAEAQLRRDLILYWVVEHHGLRATAAELDARLQEVAARSGKTAAELRASLEKAKRLRDLERGFSEEKVFTFLLSQSTVESA